MQLRLHRYFVDPPVGQIDKSSQGTLAAALLNLGLVIDLFCYAIFEPFF